MLKERHLLLGLAFRTEEAFYFIHRHLDLISTLYYLIRPSQSTEYVSRASKDSVTPPLGESLSLREYLAQLETQHI
jgi:hypothetical protein